MARDINGVEFEVGQKVNVKAVKASPWSLHEPGNYSGTVTAIHEDGPYVESKKGLICPHANECEVVKA